MSRDMKPPQNAPRKKSGGGTLLGLFIGLVVGVIAVAGVVWYVNKVPLPFTTTGQQPKLPPPVQRRARPEPTPEVPAGRHRHRWRCPASRAIRRPPKSRALTSTRSCPATPKPFPTRHSRNRDAKPGKIETNAETKPATLPPLEGKPLEIKPLIGRRKPSRRTGRPRTRNPR
jgi:hypothetical protein